MINEYLFLFLLIYILGNYYFFPKTRIINFLFSYAFTALILFPLFLDYKIIIFCALFCLINTILFWLSGNIFKFLRRYTFFCLTLFLNCISIIAMASFCELNAVSIEFADYFIELIYLLQIPFTSIFAYILAFLLAAHPANHIIKLFLESYEPENKRKDNELKTGAFIGTIERIIVVIMISMNQYAAAGLVLTAKSIARYDEISKDRSFAEYYLLGTLLSLLCALLINFLVFTNF